MDYYYGSGLNRETLSEQFDTLLDDENMTKFQQDYFLNLLNAQNMLRLSVQSMPSRDFNFLKLGKHKKLPHFTLKVNDYQAESLSFSYEYEFV